MSKEPKDINGSIISTGMIVAYSKQEERTCNSLRTGKVISTKVTAKQKKITVECPDHWNDILSIINTENKVLVIHGAIHND